MYETYLRVTVNHPGTLVATEAEGGQIAGCSRSSPTWNANEAIAIGYAFLDRRFLGAGVNTAMISLMTRHVFAKFSEVWFHIDPSNLRSARGVEKLGAHRVVTRLPPA